MSNNKLKNPEVALFRRMFSSANDEPDGLGLDLRWGVELRVASPKVQPHSSPSLALAQVKSLVRSVYVPSKLEDMEMALEVGKAEVA